MLSVNAKHVLPKVSKFKDYWKVKGKSEFSGSSPHSSPFTLINKRSKALKIVTFQIQERKKTKGFMGMRMIFPSNSWRRSLRWALRGAGTPFGDLREKEGVTTGGLQKIPQ